MRTEPAASAARAPKILLVRPAAGRFVRLGLHLIALRLCCLTACELRAALCSLDERSAARSSQAVEQHSRSAIRFSPSLTKPGCPGYATSKARCCCGAWMAQQATSSKRAFAPAIGLPSATPCGRVVFFCPSRRDLRQFGNTAFHVCLLDEVRISAWVMCEAGARS